MKKIYTAEHPAEAFFVQGLLESHGIPAQVRGAELFSAQGVLPVYGVAQATVWIADAEPESAVLSLIAGTRAPAACWRCPQCGELLEPQFSDCWHCTAAP